MQINSSKLVPIRSNSHLNIIFFGTPDFVIPVLDTLTRHYTIAAVVTTPDEKVGRKQILTPPPVKQYALDHDIPTYQPETIADLNNIAMQQFNNHRPDLFVVAAYGKIIPEKLLNLPRLGSLNIHPSRLPDLRGPSPIQETILHGEKQTAVTIIQMDKDVDHGPILAQESLELTGEETFLTLAEKTFKLGAGMLIPTIEQLNNGTITPVEQDHSKVTFTNHLTKQDGFFEIDNPPSPEVLDRMIRAYYPWPTAWTRVRIKSQESPHSGTGRIMKFLPERKLQLEGGKPMSLKDFLNGYPELRELLEPLFKK